MTAGRVGGDILHCRWRLSWPDSSVCFWEASWEAALVAHGDTRLFPDTYIESYCGDACTCQLHVKVLIQYLMSDWSRIRSGHHSALSHPSIIDADPFFSLPQFYLP